MTTEAAPGNGGGFSVVNSKLTKGIPMLIRLLKTYTITVTVQEGSDEFWESLRGKTGCDEVVKLVKDALDNQGLAEDTGCNVRLSKFEERGPIG